MGLQDPLLAVADEQAQVYRIGMTGDITRKFLSFEEPIAKGDFEGMAVLNEAVYLITSQGVAMASGFR